MSTNISYYHKIPEMALKANQKSRDCCPVCPNTMDLFKRPKMEKFI